MASTGPAPCSLPAVSRLRRIFVGRHGPRAGWRLAVFVLIFAAASAIPRILLGHFVPRLKAWADSQRVDTLTPSFTIFVESWQTVFLFLPAFVMSKIEKYSFSGYGLPGRSAFGRKFWFGSAVGVAGVCLQMGLIASFGGYSFGSLALGGGTALKYAFIWAAAFLLAALSEEFLFRGYLQTTLASGIGFWPAAVILSMGFGAAHLANPGQRWPGIAMLFCFSMLAAFTLRLTGDLWFVVGMHAAWDWAHVFLFSVPIAGMLGTRKLLHSSLHGPQWLTGGTVGPDGSMFAFVALLCITALVRWVFWYRKPILAASARSRGLW